MPHGLRKPAEGRSHWNVRKPQRGTRPRPSAHPWAFFKEFLVVEDGRVLTFVCMLRCWTWDAVPNWLLYSSVLHVRRYADTATFSQFRTGRKRPRTFVPPSQRTLLPPCAHSFHAQKKTATPNRDSRLSLTHHT